MRPKTGRPVSLRSRITGLLTSNDGRDFAAICDAIAEGGYLFGAVVVDASHFIPQSRERVFIITAHRTLPIPAELLAEGSSGPWLPPALLKAHGALSPAARDAWLWWRLPSPPARALTFADIIEDPPQGVQWHTAAETARLLEMMAPAHQAKVADAKTAGRRMVGGLYKRIRPDGNGGKIQRAEVRFDGVAGCLRVPGGGSAGRRS